MASTKLSYSFTLQKAATVLNSSWQKILRSPRHDAWKITAGGLEYSGSQNPVNGVNRVLTNMLFLTDLNYVISKIKVGENRRSGKIIDVEAIKIIAEAESTKFSADDLQKALLVLNIGRNHNDCHDGCWKIEDNNLIFRGSQSPELWNFLFNLQHKITGTDDEKKSINFFIDEEVQMIISALRQTSTKEHRVELCLSNPDVFKMLGSKIFSPEHLFVGPILRTLDSVFEEQEKNLEK